MATSTALTITGNAQIALLPRRSVDYQAWLIAEIRTLATVLGQEKALDEDGVRLERMAKALADTRQDVMTRAFERAAAECTFLPVPSELLKLYGYELKKKLEADAAKKQAEDDAEEARLRADREAHPEQYFNTADVMREFAEKSAKALDMNRERLRQIHAPKHTIAEPKIEACPHCGMNIPFSVTDLRGLSASDLRSMADRKEAQAAIAIANAAAKQELLNATPKPNTPRRRRDDVKE